MKVSRAANIQSKLAPSVRRYDDFGPAEWFCGVDVAYADSTAFAAAAVTDREGRLVESRSAKVAVRHPYIPGYFMLREAPAARRVLARLRHDYDVLLVDGHGVLHPRRCGLASYLGVTLDKPTIGVAKSLLCGIVTKDNVVEHEGEALGFALRGDGKPVYVSVGHRISLETAVKLVRMLGKVSTIPEPLRFADLISKEKRAEKLRL